MSVVTCWIFKKDGKPHLGVSDLPPDGHQNLVEYHIRSVQVDNEDSLREILEMLSQSTSLIYKKDL